MMNDHWDTVATAAVVAGVATIAILAPTRAHGAILGSAWGSVVGYSIVALIKGRKGRR
jgi:hypothetical protein